MATNARQFGLALAEFARKLPAEHLVPFHKKITLEALARIVRRSPVDTGRFRGNWQTSIGQPAAGTVEKLDPSGSDALREGASAIADLQPFSITYLANNLPYAERLEDGYSEQAPSGMVALTFAELEKAVQS